MIEQKESNAKKELYRRRRAIKTVSTEKKKKKSPFQTPK